MKLLDRKKVASNQVFDLFFDHIIDDAGRSVENFLVVNPKNFTHSRVSGVGILPVAIENTVEKKLGLIRIYRHPVSKFLWEIPRGFVDSETDSRLSAVRELEEETGIQISEDKVTALGEFYPEPGIINAKVAMYFVEFPFTKFSQGFESDEFGHEKTKFFKLDEVRKLIDSGDIADPCSLLAIERFMTFYKT